MKKQILSVFLASVLFLTAILSGCTEKVPLPPDTDELDLNHESASENVNFIYSQNLGDAAAAFYLGREYDENYHIPFNMLIPLGTDDKIITLKEVENIISPMLYRVAGLAMELPNYEGDYAHVIEDPYMPDNSQVTEEIPIVEEIFPPEEIPVPEIEIDFGLNEEEARPGLGLSYNPKQFNVFTYMVAKTENSGIAIMPLLSIIPVDNFDDERLLELFFPDGYAPNISPKNEYSVVTQEFPQLVFNAIAGSWFVR